MKYNINNLFYAKCRHYIMDIINVTDEKGNLIFPHPDYVDYYTILMFRKGKFINIDDKHVKYKSMDISDLENKYYQEDIILEICGLDEFTQTYKDKISYNECKIIDNTIQKTAMLKLKYGYNK